MIRVLDKRIADKIAAGEVIDRPVSIVKELVENAVDAKASSITVEIKNGGKSYIRVTDNGCGIPEEETETAFLRHATSKIQTVGDLDSIETLGFRGEALASICAVSRTELVTKCKESKAGTRLLIHGGEVTLHQQTGCPDGTTVIVTDLFYNTPARRKFMKSDSAESGMIIDFVSQMALAYKDIRFRLISNASVLFSTAGDGDRFNTIVRVYKNINPNNLTPVCYQEGKLRLEGYISTPAQTKNSRSSQVFFVNGRAVHSKVIEKGLTEGYRERLFEGRYPVAYLFLEADPADIDVNIHPNKKEVRFDQEAEIIDFVTRAVRISLGSETAMVSGASLFREKSSEDTAKDAHAEQVDIKKFLSSNAQEPVSAHSLDPSFLSESEPVISAPVFLKNAEQLSADLENSADSFFPSLEIETPEIRPFNFQDLQITGSIFHTYITAVTSDAFFLIDQHAAHERIFYEKLVREYEQDEKIRQPILIPLILEVSLKADADSVNWLTALAQMGYTIHEFGPGTYRITEIPAFMTLEEADQFAQDFTDQISDSTNLKNSVVIQKLIMKSCKSAVKGGDVLSMEEMEALLRDLSACVNPFSCPHGRPTFVRLTRYEIERLFKRIPS